MWCMLRDHSINLASAKQFPEMMLLLWRPQSRCDIDQVAITGIVRATESQLIAGNLTIDINPNLTAKSHGGKFLPRREMEQIEFYPELFRQRDHLQRGSQHHRKVASLTPDLGITNQWC